MKVVKYDLFSGVQRQQIKVKKIIIGAVASVSLVGGLAIPAMAAGGPTPGPVAGPGCFGNWRAGSVQDINGHAPGTDNAGALYFSNRASTNSTHNVTDKAQCEL